MDGKGSLTNLGFTEIYKYKTDKYDKKKANTADMGFMADQVYDFSCYVRSDGFTGTAQVYLDCGDGKQTAVQLDLSKTGGAWNKLTVPLTASASKDGALVFQLEGEGTLYLDFVTLVPQGSYGYGSDSWKYTTLRSDLFAALQNLHPRFIRFPGGCLAEGGSWISCTIGKIPSAPWRSASKVRTCGRTTTAGIITTPTPWVTMSISSCARI